VGLYQADTHQLLCPCHQSAFDVLDRARPVFGPATRALPQLPLVVDDEGFVRAQSDFHEPIGPAYWDRD
jgi:ubiquinol-cytochrome c reductase iron-sulfur subunit